MILEILLFLTVIYLLLNYLTPKRPTNFPPGPKNFPIMGGSWILGKLSKLPFESMMKLGDIYGPVTGINLGMNRTVIINGYEAVKEVLTRDEFQGRPTIFTNSYLMGGRMLGVMFTEGDLWKDQRRFTLRHLRDFGFGKASMESMVHEEITDCIDLIERHLKDSSNSTIHVHDIFGPPVINVLWAILAGKRFKHDDPAFLELLGKLNALFRSGNSTGNNLVNDWHFLRFIPPFKKIWNDGIERRVAVLDMVEAEIKEHISTRDDSYSRDFIDIYLQEIENSKENGNQFYFKDQLKAIGFDLFGAGAESTSNSIAFGILYMILYPEVQEKVRDELDKVVGRSRLPSYNQDRPSLPYTEAVLCELQRISGIAPNTVPHQTTQDTKLHGYDIPKDTLVFPMLVSVHYEKSYWKDPEKFNPQRFLDKDNKLVNTERIMAFGIGKRACLGEILARMNYFDFFTAMIQRFIFETAPGKPKPSAVPCSGFTIAPQPFKAKVTFRN